MRTIIFQGQYISVSLVNGKVVAEINFGDDIAIRLSTEKTHNHGEWTWVEMNRQRHRGKEEGTYLRLLPSKTWLLDLI